MTVIHDSNGVRLIHGNVTDPATLEAVPDGSVRTIVTSPPYYGLRDYGEAEQIGNEDSPAEYVARMAKNPRYYYDADAIREPFADERMGASGARSSKYMNPISGRKDGVTSPPQFDARNKRSVWDVPTVPFPGSHFAVYPPELIRPCIRAGSAVGDTVLDPFSGSGTTGMVARQEGRNYIGVDLNREYLDLSLRTRFLQPTLDFEEAS